MTDYIKDLARRVVMHPDFTKSMIDSVSSVLENIMRDDFGGEAIYIPKMGGHDAKLERNVIIKAQFNGNNIELLAKQFNLTQRQVRRILKIR